MPVDLSLSTPRILRMVLTPLVVGGVLAMVFSEALKLDMPKNLNFTEWKSLSNELQTDFRIRNRNSATIVLVVAHTLQLYLCFPMEHITKILYGYWLGFWRGYITCVFWEVVLYCAYLQRVERLEHQQVLMYLRQKRREGVLCRELVLCCLSIIPLHSKVLIVKFSDVTFCEFMTAYTLTTVIMSFKSAMVGSILAANPSSTMIPLMVATMAVIFVVHITSTIIFSSKMFRVLHSVERYDRNTLSRPKSILKTNQHQRKLSKYRCRLKTILETTEIDDDSTLLLMHDDTTIDIHDASTVQSYIRDIQDESTKDSIEIAAVQMQVLSYEKTSCLAYCEKSPARTTTVHDPGGDAF